MKKLNELTNVVSLSCIFALAFLGCGGQDSLDTNWFHLSVEQFEQKKPTATSEDLEQARASIHTVTWEDLEKAAARFRDNYPNLKELQKEIARIEVDFPLLNRQQILQNLGTIQEIYVRAMQYELIQMLIELQDARSDGLVGIRGSYPYGLCADEFWLIMSHLQYLNDILDARSNAFAFEVELFGDNTADTKGDAFRHAIWNVLMIHYTGNAGFAKKFANAHESCAPDGNDKEMDLHNNQEGRDYYARESNHNVTHMKYQVYSMALRAVYVGGKTINFSDLQRNYNNQLVYIKKTTCGGDYANCYYNSDCCSGNCVCAGEMGNTFGYCCPPGELCKFC